MFGFFKKRKQIEENQTKEEFQEKMPEEVLPPIKNEIEYQQDDFSSKLELLTAKLDSLKLQYETLKEKVDNIEKMVKEIYEMAKSE